MGSKKLLKKKWKKWKSQKLVSFLKNWRETENLINVFFLNTETKKRSVEEDVEASNKKPKVAEEVSEEQPIVQSEI